MRSTEFNQFLNALNINMQKKVRLLRDKELKVCPEAANILEHFKEEETIFLGS